MKRSLALTGVIFLSLFGFASHLQAATFTVTTSSDNDCTDFNCDLQAALTAAGGNGESDTINIQSGNYNITSNSNNPFTYAPLATEGFTLSIIGTGTTPPVLDGNGTSTPFNQVLHIDLTLVNSPAEASAGITIQGITIQNGNSGSNNGGGLFIDTNDANILVENCIFMNNFSDNISGAAEINAQDNGTITLNSNQFIGNSSTSGIGAIDAFTDQGIITITGNTFTGNTTAGSDGAIDTGSDFGAVDVSDNLFVGNKANGGVDGAGEIDCNSGLITVTNNIVLGNSAQGDTGGLLIATTSSGMNIINNTVSGNTAGTSGGGIHVQPRDDTATTNIDNNIIWGNTAPTSGSDIFVEDNLDNTGAGAPVNLLNNDFTGFACSGICAGNLVQSNNLDVDPLFVDVANQNVNLQGGSQCIDKGLASAPGMPPLDFAGNPRPFGTAPDMGALEASSLLSVAPPNHDFGTIAVGANDSVIITITNAGGVAANITGMTLSDAVNFTLDPSAGPNPCGSTALTLNGGQSCTVAVIFLPGSEGAFSATLDIASDDPQNPVLQVTVTGTGTSSGDLQGSGCSLAMGDTPSGFWTLGLSSLGILLWSFRRKS